MTETWFVTVTKFVDGVSTRESRQRMFEEPVRILTKREYEELKGGQGKPRETDDLDR